MRVGDVSKSAIHYHVVPELDTPLGAIGCIELR